MFEEFMSEEDIISTLKEADDAYYNSASGSSALTDDEYDDLKEYAQKKFPNNEYFKNVGAPIPEKSVKVKHDYILGSLKKVKPEDFPKWYSKYSKNDLYVIMPKLDGASLFVRYEDGVLTRATTRGDGFEGFDITHKMKKCLPNKIKLKGTVDLRGECLLNREEAKSLGFANARNGVSGLLNRDGVENCEYINVLFYEYINSKNSSLIEDFTEISEAGLKTVEYHLLSDLSVDQLKEILISMKIDYSFDLDGLVLAPVNYKRENVERPDHKIAFKVNSEGVDAIVDHIEWNTTRTGKVVPVAIFKEPVYIDGSNVSRAACHNAKYLNERKIGPGANVKIIKSGDIIPKIIEVTIPAAVVKNPIECPSCGTKLKFNDTNLYCSNKLYCYDQVIGFLEYFFKTLGVENVSGQTFRNLGVKNLDEVFLLNENIIANMEGFGDSSANLIVSEIQNAIKDVRPEILLAAMGIPNFGIKNSKKFIDSLDKSLSSKEKFESIFSLNESRFTSLPSFGKSIFNSVIDSLGNIALVYSVCQKHNLTFNEEALSEENKDVVKVTVTGKGPYGRKDLEKMFLEKGFEIIDFSSETKILICDDVNSSSSKMKKAKKNNVEIVTYEEFFNEYM